MAQHNELGKKGEQNAKEFLVEKGYRILETNYQYQKAEIDIIAQKEDILVIVEVKTRSTDYFGNPEDFINAQKIQLLVAATNKYIEERGIDVEVRFDIIAILQKNGKLLIEHIENAFLYF